MISLSRIFTGAVVGASAIVTFVGSANALPTFIGPSAYQCYDAGQPGGTTNLGSNADSSVGAAIHQLGAFTGTCNNDSPFTGVPGSAGATWFFVEDYEDNTFTPGHTASLTNIINSGTAGLTPYIDSVDADDGAVDGSGLGGSSNYNTSGATGFTFTFNPGDAALNGFFPTHAGIVWTDGTGPVTFEAFDTQGASLGTTVSSHGVSGSWTGQTDEDVFFGIINDAGIGSIKISQSGGSGLEVDHLQYGRLVNVPEPATLALLGLGLAGLGAARRRRKAA